MNRQFAYARGLSLATALVLLLFLELDVLPPLWGVRIPLVLPFVVAVGMVEGPYLAAGLGVAAGLVLDQGCTTAYGFSALLLLVVGVAAGLLVSFFRLRRLTALLFTLGAGLVVFPLRWFFLCGLWYGNQGFFRYVPLELLYAGVMAFPISMGVGFLSRRFGSLRKADRLTPRGG